MDFPFSFHESEELGPAVLAKISKKTGLRPRGISSERSSGAFADTFHEAPFFRDYRKLLNFRIADDPLGLRKYLGEEFRRLAEQKESRIE